ncbi:MAG: ATP-binding protein [Candidatus Kapaibacterium sp.]
MTDIHTISLPADTHHLAELRSFINAAGMDHHIDSSVLHYLELAADEVVTNVIEHSASGGDIFCSCVINSEMHTVICEISWISDEPFVPEVFPEPEHIRRRLETREPGGLGVFLIHSLVDQIEYDYSGGRSIIRLAKKLE